MSTLAINFNTATVTAGTYVGDGANLTGITRSNLAAGSANEFVYNNGSGVLTSTDFLAVSGNDLQLKPSNDVVLVDGKNLYLDTSKKTQTMVKTVQTTDATATALLSFTTAPNTAYLVKFDIVCNNATDGGSGSHSAIFKVNQGAADATPSVSSLIQLLTILDTSVNTSAVSTSASANTFNLRVAGVASKTINWRGCFTMVAQ